MDKWLGTLRRAIVQSQDAGHVALEADPQRLAFEFNALELGTNSSMQLHGSRQGFKYARDAILERLQQYATAKGASPCNQVASASPRSGTRKSYCHKNLQRDLGGKLDADPRLARVNYLLIKR